MMSTPSGIDLENLRAAIALSRQASERGDEPFGAVLADARGRILLSAQNTQVTGRDCTGHAETNLLREASQAFGRAELQSCTVYASGEPCAMCAGALFFSNVRRLVFALDADTTRRLAGEGVDEILLSSRDVLSRGMHPVEVIGPLLLDEAGEVLRKHYASR